jgi:hypothetical protein
MMKKKLVPAFAVIASVIAFAPNIAQARGHHQRGVHYSGHQSSLRHHAASGDRHRAGRHLSRSARRHAGRVAQSGGGRPGAWCGWWLENQLGLNDRKLWLARNWTSVGSNAGQPAVGVVVVWRHHVGIITGRSGSDWIIKSGNDGHTVRERVRSIAGAIAFRRLG